MPTHISRDDLHHRITNGDRPILVEALGAGYYADAHLPGAINIPPGHVDRLAAGAPARPAGADRRVLHRRRAPAATPSPDASKSSATRPSPCTSAARRTGSNTACPLERPDTDGDDARSIGPRCARSITDPRKARSVRY